MDDTTTGEDPLWQALADYQIIVTMNKMLNLVPRFRQAMETRMRNIDRVMIPTKFAESITGLAMVDHHNPAIKVILQGEEITGCIVDGGSGVNVISKAT